MDNPRNNNRPPDRGGQPRRKRGSLSGKQKLASVVGVVALVAAFFPQLTPLVPVAQSIQSAFSTQNSDDVQYGRD